METYVIHMELMATMKDINVYCFEIAENIIRFASQEKDWQTLVIKWFILRAPILYVSS